MGSGNREVRRRITLVVVTGNREEGLHRKWEQGGGKKDYMGSGNRAVGRSWYNLGPIPPVK